MQRPKGIDVSIRDIAAAAGCSRSTVSRVLRGGSYVRDELRAKVEKVVKEMGYRPNPLVVSLMSSQNSRRGRKRLSANIAWVNAHPNKEFWHIYPHRRRFYEAAKRRSLEIGFGFDEIWLQEPGLSGARLSQILDARGVHGLLVSGTLDIMNLMSFDASKYAVAAIGAESVGQLDWNRAGVSSRHNIETVHQNLRTRNYHKIAYALPLRNASESDIAAFNRGQPGSASSILEEGDRAELSGYLICQSDLQVEERIAPFAYNRNDEDHFLDDLAEWIDKTQPDAVICSDRCVFDAIEKTGRRVPADIAIAHLRIADDVQDWAGMEVHPEAQAEAAVEMLSSSIQYNRRGEPRTAQYLYIKGTWQDGWTA